MATFIQCDVKGCDEVAPVPNAMSHPHGWATLNYAVTDSKELAVLEAQDDALVDMLPPYVQPAMSGARHRHRTVVMCPSHNLPEFEAPAPLDPNKFSTAPYGVL